MNSTLKLAETCSTILNNPESNLEKINDVLEDDGLVLISLAKVFTTICPLYKIRVHSEKIKHKGSEIELTVFDKNLVKIYEKYIKILIKSRSKESYLASCILLKSLDHFNFVDSIVSKVLLGTRVADVAPKCRLTLVNRIENDLEGECVFLILDKCLDFSFSHEICETLTNCQFLQKCVEIRIAKEEKYDKKKPLEKRIKKFGTKQEKQFFKSKKMRGKEGKEEKKRLIKQNEQRVEESTNLDQINEKIYIKTVNAYQRLIFTVLKENKLRHIPGVCKSIRMFHRIIRKEFYEGLYALLNDNISTGGLECIETILFLYKDKGIDHKRSIQRIYEIIKPFNSENIDFSKCFELIRELFLSSKNLTKRATLIIQRLMLLGVVRYIPNLSELISDMVNFYDLNLKDFDKRVSFNNNFDFTSDIDRQGDRFTFEYFSFRKMI